MEAHTGRQRVLGRIGEEPRVLQETAHTIALQLDVGLQHIEHLQFVRIEGQAVARRVDHVPLAQPIGDVLKLVLEAPVQLAVSVQPMADVVQAGHIGRQVIAGMVQKGAYATVEGHFAQIVATKVVVQLSQPILPLHIKSLALVAAIGRGDELVAQLLRRAILGHQRTCHGLEGVHLLPIKIDC